MEKRCVGEGRRTRRRCPPPNPFLDQRHYVEFLFFDFCRVKNCTHDNLVNLGQSSTHHGQNCPDFRYWDTIFLSGQLFTWPNQEYKFYIMSLIPFFGRAMAPMHVPLIFPAYGVKRYDQRNPQKTFFFVNSPLRGGGVKALVDCPLKKNFFPAS